MYRIVLELADEQVEKHLGYTPDIGKDTYSIVGILRDFGAVPTTDGTDWLGLTHYEEAQQ